MTFWFIYFDVLLWVTRISYVWPIIPDLWHAWLWGSWSPKPWDRFSYSNKADIQLPSLKQTGQPGRNLGDGSIRFWANPVCFVFRDIIRDWEHSSLGTKDSSSFWLKLADKALPLLLPWNSTNIIVMILLWTKTKGRRGIWQQYDCRSWKEGGWMGNDLATWESRSQTERKMKTLIFPYRILKILGNRQDWVLLEVEAKVRLKTKGLVECTFKKH